MEKVVNRNKNLKSLYETPRKPWRSVTVNNEIWGWQIRKQSIIFLVPSGKKIAYINIPSFLGISHDEYSRVIWKGGNFKLTPARVCEWIKSGFSLYPLTKEQQLLLGDYYTVSTRKIKISKLL